MTRHLYTVSADIKKHLFFAGFLQSISRDGASFTMGWGLPNLEAMFQGTAYLSQAELAGCLQVFSIFACFFFFEITQILLDLIFSLIILDVRRFFLDVPGSENRVCSPLEPPSHHHGDNEDWPVKVFLPHHVQTNKKTEVKLPLSLNRLTNQWYDDV